MDVQREQFPARPHGLTVGFETTDDAIIGRVFGELDLHTTPKLDKELEVAFAGSDLERGTLVLDLRGVTVLDSTGLRALWTIRHEMREIGGRLVLRSPSDQVMRTFLVTGLESQFDIE